MKEEERQMPNKTHKEVFDDGWAAASKDELRSACPYNVQNHGGFSRAWLRGWEEFHIAWHSQIEKERIANYPTSFTCSDCGTILLENGAIRKAAIEVGNWQVLMDNFEDAVNYHTQLHERDRLNHLIGLGAAYYIEKFLRSIL